jgi:predicted dithiol-disulfide oxidoreductase (DUF899 family)
MNEQELQAIEARCNAATPGPWGEEKDDRSYIVIAPHPELGSCNCCIAEIDGWFSDDSKRDCAFIAAARADVPALLAEVRALRAKLDAVPVEALLFWWDPFTAKLTNEAIEKAFTTIEAWLKTQEASI